MTLTTQEIPSLFNGVSRQPDSRRLPSQSEENINCWPSVVTGVRKRPPFQHVAKISSENLSDAFMHSIDRDATEKYLVICTDGDLKVYTQGGTEIAVNFPNGKSYLDVANAETDFAIVTIADYSFVINKTKVVDLLPSSSPVVDQSTYYYPPQWGRGYEAGFTPYNVNITSNRLGSYQGEVQSFAQLPKDNDDDPDETNPPATGHIYKITGADGSSFGAYYVIWKATGVWEETFEPGIQNDLNPDTMPHALVRLSDGTFEFSPFSWLPRKVGDDQTNPPATFVGRSLNDVFYYKNRLGFVSDENVIFSGVGSYGNFWRTTVTDLLDSDVVDVAVATSKVSTLRYAVAFENNLMLFADETQFSLNVTDLLTPASVSIDEVTAYSMNKAIRPHPVGSDVYFVSETDTYSRVREYFKPEEGNSTDATDVSEHVPGYLPINIHTLTGNSDEDVIFLASKDEPNTLYQYKFFWTPEGKVQSAWGKWSLGSDGTILYVSTNRSNLYALIQRDDGVYLEKADLEEGASITEEYDRDILLDRRLTLNNGTATLTLPYEVPESDRGNYRFVYSPDFADKPLSSVSDGNITWVDNNTVTIADASTGDVYSGYLYDKSITLSKQYLRKNDQVITSGRLQIKRMDVEFFDTSFFEVEVQPFGVNATESGQSSVRRNTYEGMKIGENSLQLGTPFFESGLFSFLPGCRGDQGRITISNGSHVQSIINRIDWVGFYNNRARA